MIHLSYHLNPQTVLNTQKSLPLIRPPNKMLARFSYPQISFDHPRHLKSGVLPPPPPPGYLASQEQ